MVKNRQVRVRFAVHGATIKIKELSPVVSNEMLYLTFSAFGEVERAVHIVDEKGKPTGEGIIEFERKTSAQEAIAQIKERVFLLTANSRPLQCDILEPKDEEDGFSEKMISKTHQLIKERELGPRFAAMNSFEYVYGRRWKDLYEYENKRRQELEAELREQRRRLDSDMEVAYEDYKAELLREELQRRQEELERLDAARRARDAQRHQMMMEPMGGDRWVPPPLVDGPLGRPPPQFGAGGMGGGGLRPPPPGGLMIPPPPFGQGPPPGNDMGGMPMGLGGGGGGPMGPGGGGGPRDGGQQNGHGKHTPPMPQIDPNLRKLLQSFKDPVIPGGPNPGGQQGGPIRFPPPMNPLDRNTEPCPLSAFANMLQNPRGNDGGGGPLGGGPGGPPPRIPPPPPPMGLNKPPMMMDFPPPPDKRSRR